MQRLTFSFHGVEFPAILLDRGEWIFSANVVCIECELVTNQSNVSRYLQRVIPAQYYFEFNPQDGGRPGYYLKLPGMFRLLLLTNTEKGEDFRYWVCDEVLPSILEKDAYYDKSVFSAEEIEQLEAIIQKKDIRIARLELEKQVLTDEKYKAVERISFLKSENEIEANMLLDINREKTTRIYKLEEELQTERKKNMPLPRMTFKDDVNTEQMYSEREYQKLKSDIKSLKNEIDKYKRKESFASKLDQLMRFVLTSRPTPLRKQIMLLFGWNEKTPLPKDNF